MGSRRPYRRQRIAQEVPRAFTLAELVVSLSIMGIIMAGLGSAILIASHALPDEDSPGDAILACTCVADQIAEELSSAIWVREHTPNTIDFTIPDRDEDGLPEHLRYEWSGTPGDALTRQYNGGAIVDAIDSVHDFRLGYALVTLTEEYDGPVVESAVGLLSSRSSIVDSSDKKIETSKWMGQHFVPTLPADAITWSVTRAWFQAKREGNPVESMWAQIREVDANNAPTGTVLDQVRIDEWQLSTYYDWISADFDEVRGRAPGTGLYLVFQHSGIGGPAANVRYEDDVGSGRAWTDNAGSSWTYQTSKSVYHYIYGTYTTPTAAQTAMRTYIADVTVTIQPTDTPSDTVVTAARMLNTPELLSGMWETSFDSDPSLDHNGDGEADWVMLYGGDFDDGWLLDRTWSAETYIVTWPKHNFTTLTTATARMKTTRFGATGAVFGVTADTVNGTHAALRTILTRNIVNTQTLELAEKQTDSSLKTLIKVPGLPDGFIEVRMVIDPNHDTVSLTVDGVHRGTFTYTPTVPASDERFVLVGGAGAAFDSVSVRASE
ncbi:MAG: prepilin-type N-terminal cleavage/methylation domain-containing protein [Phycisphaerae bacterium]|nr:prepilin-type N-terminal cleavage/methylation domain-containing protein [Phycisphaerae bacterium]